MKKLFFMVLVVVMAVSAFGQKQLSKDELFKEMAALTKTQTAADNDKAYALAKEFIARFGNDKDDKVTKIKTFVDTYREHLFFEAVKAHKYADVFSIGKEILAAQPENVDVMMNMAYEGYSSVNGTQDRTYADDSIAYAKQAVKLLDGGNTPKSFAPFKDKPEAEAFMYFVAGSLVADKDPREAAIDAYKALQFESSIKNSSLPYYMLALYYEDLYGKLSTALKAKVDAHTITPEQQKAENDKVNKVIDAMLDAYARTVTRAEAEKSPGLAEWNQRLLQVYKFERKTDLGFKEFIAAANVAPLPDPSTY